MTGFISRSNHTWFIRNMKSSAVSGAPSDHLIPGRRRIVVTRPSSLRRQDSARLGSTLRRSAEIVRACSKLKNCQLSHSVMRAVPPYLPIFRYGCTTTGSSGRRASTGGRSRPSSIGLWKNCVMPSSLAVFGAANHSGGNGGTSSSAAMTRAAATAAMHARIPGIVRLPVHS